MNKQPRRSASVWILIICCGVVAGLTLGLRLATGLYMPLVTKALGIGIEPFSTALAVANLLWGAVGVVAGAVADKHGAGRVAIVGVVVMIAGYLVLYLASGSPHLMVSGVLLGIGAGSCGASVMAGAIGRAATPDDRTAALAALSISLGIGNFIVFPYTHLFIEVLGWQGSLLAVIATLAAIIPLGFIIQARSVTATTVARPQTLAEAVREAVRLPSYWLLTLGFFICGFQIAFYSGHLPVYAANLGLPSWVAVASLTAVGAANIVGSWLAGRSARYMPKRYALSAIYAARCVPFLGLLVLPMDAPVMIALSALLGLFWLATVPLTSSMVATFFGTTWLSMLYGAVFFAHQLGSFVGVWLAGVLYEATRSYDTMWIISIALGLTAAAIHWPIREEPVPRLRPATA